MFSPLVKALGVRRGGAIFVRSKNENWILFSPVVIGTVVAIFSMLNGASMNFVPLQFMMFALIVPLLFIIKFDDRFVGGVLLFTFLKIFFIGQIVCLFFLRAPDSGLQNPSLTTFCMVIGLVSGMGGIAFARVISQPITARSPLLRFDLGRLSLLKVAYPAAAVGLVSQIVSTMATSRLTAAQHGGVGGNVPGIVVFAYLAPLALLSMCCFAAHNLRSSNSQKLFSRELIIVLGLYFAATAPLASKTEPLLPVVALALVAFIYRWRLRAGPMVVGALTVLLVSQFVFPVVNYARLYAFGQERSVAAVFLETSGAIIRDPGKFEQIGTFSQNYERAIGQNYFGRSVGFLDRFTPLRTDQIISAAQYSEPVGVRVFGEAAISILPQTLGFRRDVTGVQTRIEQALFRKRSELGKVNWENVGFVADGYFSGGLSMVAAFMFLFGLIGSLAARMTFGVKGGGVIWIPFFCEFMQIPAGSTFAGVPPQFFWEWVILAAGTYIIIRSAERSSVLGVATGHSRWRSIRTR